MDSNLNWNLVFLKKNPFNLTPADSEQIVWAGMKELKQQFERIFEIARSDSVTQVILNQGPYGGGKTHASFYFRNLNNLPSGQWNGSAIYQFNICVPKEPGNVAADFYTSILDTIGLSRIHQIIKDAIDGLSESDALTLLQETLSSEELARAFWLYGTEKTNEKKMLFRSYFFEGCTRTDLRKLGIARNITNAQDRFRVIAGVFRCLIGLKSDHNSRVCLWIDEVEDLIYFTSAQFRIMSQGLRDMIDRLPRSFTLFLNATLAEPADEEIETILGRALLDRVTDHIYFPELNVGEAVEYVDQLMNHAQYRDSSLLPNELPDTYPFNQAGLKTLLENLIKRTPRDINKRCSSAIHFAFGDNNFKPGESIIDPTYVTKIEANELEREI